VEAYQQGAGRALLGGHAQVAMSAKADAYAAILDLVEHMLAELPDEPKETLP
jgi:hypothetical protein